MCVVYDYVCVVYVLRGKTPRAKTSLFFFASTAIQLYMYVAKPADLLMHVVDERISQELGVAQSSPRPRTDEHTRARWLSCFAAHAPPAC